MNGALAQRPCELTAQSSKVGSHILFVDDDTSLCDMLSLYFEHFGVRVSTAGKPSPAIELLSAVTFDAVILDLNLAGEDGLEVLRFAKSKFPALPVIIFTGLDVDEGLIKKCLADRADAFMRKTAGLGTLLTKVQQYLQSSERSCPTA